MRTCTSGCTKAWTDPREEAPLLPWQGWAHSWQAGAASTSLFRLVILEEYSSSRTVQKVHQVLLGFCLTAEESSLMPPRVRSQSLGCFRHAPSSLSVLRCSLRVRMQPAPAKTHCICALHYWHRHGVVYSVAGARGCVLNQAL